MKDIHSVILFDTLVLPNPIIQLIAYHRTLIFTTEVKEVKEFLQSWVFGY